MPAYYNEFDPKAAAWLRELMKGGHIPEGEVDERSIADVRPADLAGFTQCHFFAGIGGWPYALRLAGWPDDRPVWTGSCPCQPFSAAGKRKGPADDRHLWPAFRGLIREGEPPAVFGEQVASSEVVGTELEAAFLVAVQSRDYGRANKLAKRLAQSRGFHYWPRWVDAVRRDLEAIGYAFGFTVLGAHSAGAPHIRQRLFWVADADRSGVRADGHRSHDGAAGGAEGEARERERVRDDDGASGPACGLADAVPAGRAESGRGSAPSGGGFGGVGHADEPGPQGRVKRGDGARECAAGAASVAGAWADLAWLPCRDGKARPTQPGLFPLAHGVSGRVGLLRGYGNAIIPQAAAAFIEAYTDTHA